MKLVAVTGGVQLLDANDNILYHFPPNRFIYPNPNPLESGSILIGERFQDPNAISIKASEITDLGDVTGTWTVQQLMAELPNFFFDSNVKEVTCIGEAQTAVQVLQAESASFGLPFNLALGEGWVIESSAFLKFTKPCKRIEFQVQVNWITTAANARRCFQLGIYNVTDTPQILLGKATGFTFHTNAALPGTTTLIFVDNNPSPDKIYGLEFRELTGTATITLASDRAGIFSAKAIL